MNSVLRLRIKLRLRVKTVLGSWPDSSKHVCIITCSIRLFLKVLQVRDYVIYLSNIDKHLQRILSSAEYLEKELCTLIAQ